VRLETGDWKLETGNWRLGTGDWGLETRDWNKEQGTKNKEQGLNCLYQFNNRIGNSIIQRNKSYSEAVFVLKAKRSHSEAISKRART
jgi:hypothetical protein